MKFSKEEQVKAVKELRDQQQHQYDAAVLSKNAAERGMEHHLHNLSMYKNKLKELLQS